MNEPNYVASMNGGLTTSVNDWWEGLSKDNLLAFLQDNPEVSADMLRAMIAYANVTLTFNVTFNSTEKKSSVEFFSQNVEDQK